MNGTAYINLPPALRVDLNADVESVGDIKVYTLTILGRAEYNDTVVQCVAGDIGGGSVESANATLRVQGNKMSTLYKVSMHQKFIYMDYPDMLFC